MATLLLLTLVDIVVGAVNVNVALVFAFAAGADVVDVDAADTWTSHMVK